MRPLGAALLLFTALLCLDAAIADPPKLVKSSPADGAAGVPADIGRVIIRFDRNMKMDSWTLTTAGDRPFPPMIPDDEPWQDPITFVLRVQGLKPGTTYAIQLNSQKHKGFMAAEDQAPLPVTTISFTTAQAGEKLDTSGAIGTRASESQTPPAAGQRAEPAPPQLGQPQLGQIQREHPQPDQPQLDQPQLDQPQTGEQRPESGFPEAAQPRRAPTAQWPGDVVGDLAANARPKLKPNLKTGWDFRVLRRIDMTGIVREAGEQSPLDFHSDVEFTEQVQEVRDGAARRVLREAVRAEQRRGGKVQRLAEPGQTFVVVGDAARTMVSQPGVSGAPGAIDDPAAREAFSWHTALDIWPEDGLSRGQSWIYTGQQVTQRLIALGARGGELKLRVERIAQDPKTGLVTAYVRGRLRTLLPFEQEPLELNAQVDIDVPLAIGVPFRTELKGDLYSQGADWGERTAPTMQASYRAVQLVMPSTRVIAQVRHGEVAATAPEPLTMQASPPPTASAWTVPLPPALQRPIPAGREPEAPGSPAALFTAAEVGEVDKVKDLLARGADPNVRSPSGDTALMLAAAGGQTAVTQLLLDKGADVNARNENGETALIRAAVRGDAASVDALLAARADTSARDTHGWTALMAAVLSHHLGPVRSLLNAGADANVQDESGQTPLMLAARNGYADLAIMLLDHHADMVLRDRQGGTALMQAARNRHAEVLGVLLDRGASPNVQDGEGMTALMWAARGGDLAAVKRLLAKGADVGLKDEKGRTALDWAQGHADLAQLLQPTPGPARAEQVEAKPAPAPAVAEKGEPAPAPVPVLPATGVPSPPEPAPPAAPETKPSAPISLPPPAQTASAPVPDVNQKDSESLTALLRAVDAADVDKARTLLERGADVNARDKDGATALMLAVISSSSELLQLLLDRNADVNLPDNDGRTALMAAAAMGQSAMVQALIGKGADRGLKDKQGRTALDWAKAKGQAQIVPLLQEPKPGLKREPEQRQAPQGQPSAPQPDSGTGGSSPVEQLQK